MCHYFPVLLQVVVKLITDDPARQAQQALDSITADEKRPVAQLQADRDGFLTLVLIVQQLVSNRRVGIGGPDRQDHQFRPLKAPYDGVGTHAK